MGDKEDKKKEGIAKNEFQRLKNIAKQSEGRSYKLVHTPRGQLLHLIPHDSNYPLSRVLKGFTLA